MLPTDLSATFICKTKVVVPSWPSLQGCNRSLIRCCESDTVPCCTVLIRLLSEQWIRMAELLISGRASQSAFPDYWILVIMPATQGWGRQGEESKPQGLTLAGDTDVIVASFLHVEPGSLVWGSCLQGSLLRPPRVPGHCSLWVLWQSWSVSHSSLWNFRETWGGWLWHLGKWENDCLFCFWSILTYPQAGPGQPWIQLEDPDLLHSAGLTCFISEEAWGQSWAFLPGPGGRTFWKQTCLPVAIYA